VVQDELETMTANDSKTAAKDQEIFALFEGKVFALFSNFC